MIMLWVYFLLLRALPWELVVLQWEKGIIISIIAV